eukprot:PITA_33392
MGSQGLCLNRWMLNFDPTVDVALAIPVWVRLPNLPIHCWNWYLLKHIGNTLRKFIDRENNKDQYEYCARICVEVDLEVGRPEASKIKVGNWIHLQKLDYEQLPFKCRKCHVYDHFARGCPTNEEPDKGKEEGWNHVKCTRKTQKQVGPIGKGTQPPPQQPPPRMVQENKFASLSLQVEETQELENQKSTSPSKGTPKRSGNGVEHAGSGVPTIEAIAESGVIVMAMARSSKGNIFEEEEDKHESECSEEEGEIGKSQATIWRSARGRKSDREKREQETFKDKLQGSQPTLEKETKLEDYVFLHASKKLWNKCEAKGISTNGASGGFGSLWNATKFTLVSETLNSHWLLLKLQHIDSKEIISLFNVYASVNVVEKKDCWDSIRTQADLVNIENIIIAGDLNLTLLSTDKIGGNIVRDPEREWVEDLIQD